MSLKGLPRGPCACEYPSTYFVSFHNLLFVADFDTRQHEAGISLDGIRNSADHANRRRPWTRAMNVAAVNQYVGPMKEKIQELLDVLRENQSTPIDLSRWLILFGYVRLCQLEMMATEKM